MTHLDIDQLQHLLTILTFQYGEQDLKNKHFFSAFYKKLMMLMIIKVYCQQC